MAKATEKSKVDSKEKSEKVVTKKTPEKKVTSKPKLQKAPTNMEELLKTQTQTLQVPQVGDVVEGIITEISKRQIMIDIAAKTEGVVSDREFDVAKDYIKELQIGDTVSAYVMSTETERGQIILSLRKAALNQKWDLLEHALNAGTTVLVDGIELNRGGMIVGFQELRGFVPTSQFSKQMNEDLDQLLNKEFEVKVIEADKEKNRLIFSERYVSEAEQLAVKTAVMNDLKVGEAYEGTVSGVMPFGVFVSLMIGNEKSKKEDSSTKIEGLVHISEVSWQKIEDLQSMYSVGDKVKVQLMSLDMATGKVNLSIKQLSDDPWSTAADRYPDGSVVQGQVTRIAPFGIFVMIEPGIDGLIHISKVPAGEEPKVHDTIQVVVERLEPEARRMSLGIVLTEVPVGYK